MLNILVNLELGTAKPSQTTTIKAGGAVPVTVTFSADPGESPLIELALSADSSSPSVLAYLDQWEAQSETVFTGTLDASDARLLAFLASKSQQSLACEVVVTAAGAQRQPFPNFPVTAQQPIITGPETTEGGPTYLTDTAGDARYTKLGDAYGSTRFTENGLEIRDSVSGVWRRVSFAGGQLDFEELAL